MSTYLLSKTVIKQIDKFRKHCLWRGSDANNRKPPKAAWPLVRLPKDCGGLGVLDLHKHNQGLLLKNLHKFFNKLDILGSILFGPLHMLMAVYQTLIARALFGGAIFRN